VANLQFGYAATMMHLQNIHFKVIGSNSKSREQKACPRIS